MSRIVSVDAGKRTRYNGAAKDRRGERSLDIYRENQLQDCPYCGGAGLLEEENGWCWYAMCLDCGAQTAPFDYHTPGERALAAQRAAYTWNIGKVLRSDNGE